MAAKALELGLSGDTASALWILGSPNTGSDAAPSADAEAEDEAAAAGAEVESGADAETKTTEFGRETVTVEAESASRGIVEVVAGVIAGRREEMDETADELAGAMAAEGVALAEDTAALEGVTAEVVGLPLIKSKGSALRRLREVQSGKQEAWAWRRAPRP